MHHASSSSAHSFVSAKVGTPVYAQYAQQPSSPSWSDRTTESSYSLSPWAPHMSTVPLPSATAGTSRHSARHLPDPRSPYSTLHPVLQHDRAGRLVFDVTQSVTRIQFHPQLRADLRAPALGPHPVTQMTLRIPAVTPLVFTVTNPHGVTLENVLMMISMQYAGQLDGTEYARLSQGLRDSTLKAFQARTQRNPAEFSQGMKLCDCLGAKVYFVGLSRATDGLNGWDVRLAGAFTA